MIVQFNCLQYIRMRQPSLIIACLLLAFFTAAVLADADQPQDDKTPPDQPQGPPPALVAVTPAITQQLQNRFQVVGRLYEVKRSVVATEQEGRILALNVELGDTVIAGKTVLAPIDDVFIQLEIKAHKARVQAATSSLVVAEAILEQAKRDYKYLLELEAKRSAKPKEVQDADTRVKAEQARLNTAQANIALAQAGLDYAQKQLERMVVLAPFNGVVVKKLTEAGQWVHVGDGVVEIISRGQIDALIDVPEKIINNLKLGMPIDINITALDKVVTGKVAAINPFSMSAARTFPVKVRLDDQAGQLKVGMSVKALVPMSQKVDVITVPHDAISYTPSGTVVWAAVEEKAVKLPVKILFSQNEFVAVKPLPTSMGTPLAAGMLVVIEGAEGLMMTGHPVKIANPQAMKENALSSQ